MGSIDSSTPLIPISSSSVEGGKVPHLSLEGLRNRKLPEQRGETPVDPNALTVRAGANEECSANAQLLDTDKAQKTAQSTLAKFGDGIAGVGADVGKGLLRAGAAILGAALYGTTKVLTIPLAFTLGLTSAYTTFPASMLLKSIGKVDTFFDTVHTGAAALCAAKPIGQLSAFLFNYAVGGNDQDKEILKSRLAKIDDAVSNGSLFAGLLTGFNLGGFIPIGLSAGLNFLAKPLFHN